MVRLPRPLWRDVLAVTLLILLAAFLYRPWQALPLDVWDYQEFLPILAAHDGALDRLIALLSYYANHGRMNPTFYATFVVQYEWFGADSLGWRLVRFGIMSANVVLLYALIRRLGAARVATTAACVLLVSATPAVRAWVQLMAEPQVTLALLLAMHLAIGYASAAAWRGRAVAMVALIAMVFLSKEVDGVLGAAIVMIAIALPAIHGRAVEWRSRRNIALVSGAALAALAVFVMLALVRSGATGYGMAYGSGSITAVRFFANVAAMIMPVRPAAGVIAGLAYPPNVLLVIALVTGAYLARRAVPGRRVAMVAMFGLLPPLLGAIAFLPWPKFDTFYALPFFLGPIVLAALAFDRIIRDVRWGVGVTVGAGVLIAVLTAIPAQRSTEAANASLRLNDFVARTMGRFGPTDTLVIVGPMSGGRALTVKPDELRHHAIALGHVSNESAPVVLAAPCDAYDPAVPIVGEHRAIVSYSYGCGRLPDPVLRVASPYSWREWTTLRTVPDSMSVDLAGPAVSRAFAPGP